MLTASSGCGPSPFRGRWRGLMNLEILTPDKKLFSGEVYGVQLPGITGLFEVLDKHAPLVSALKSGRVKVLKDKSNHLAYYEIQSGFVEVVGNKTTRSEEHRVGKECRSRWSPYH